MKAFLVIGLLLLLHAVYSTIEFHKFNKDLVHPISLPKDILVQLIVSALFTAWFAVPSTESLSKIRADEFYHDFSYEQGQSTPVFRNFYGSRATLISKRANLSIPKPPNS